MLIMLLETIVMVLAVQEGDPVEAHRLIQVQMTFVEREVTAVPLTVRLLQEELSPDKEHKMVVSIRRKITVPAFHRKCDLRLETGDWTSL